MPFEGRIERPPSYDGAERARYAAKAERWTVNQAQRLNCSADEILDAIKAGWLPENVESITSRYALEGVPPPRDDVPSWADARLGAKLRKAKPVTCVTQAA